MVHKSRLNLALTVVSLVILIGLDFASATAKPWLIALLIEAAVIVLFSRALAWIVKDREFLRYTYLILFGLIFWKAMAARALLDSSDPALFRMCLPALYVGLCVVLYRFDVSGLPDQDEPESRESAAGLDEQSEPSSGEIDSESQVAEDSQGMLDEWAELLHVAHDSIIRSGFYDSPHPSPVHGGPELLNHLQPVITGLRSHGSSRAPHLLTTALIRRSELLYAQGQLDEARGNAQEAREIARRHGFWRDAASANTALGVVYHALGDFSKFRRHRSEAAECLRQAGEPAPANAIKRIVASERLFGLYVCVKFLLVFFGWLSMVCLIVGLPTYLLYKLVRLFL